MHTAPLHHVSSHSWTVVLGLVIALALALLPAWPSTAQAQQEQDRAGLEHACPEGDVPPQGFTDIQGNIHRDAINCAGWWDITRGGPGGLPASQYGPTLPVYRDQMASFIARMIDESDGEPLAAWDGQNRFTDVSDENVHVQNINRLAAAGIVLGRTATEYAPRMVVRRDQMASFIARAIAHVTGQDRATEDDQFDDVDQDNVHRPNINGLAVEGVVRGIGGGRYAPAVQVRRDAMASFVMRGIDLHVEEGFATPPDTDDDDPPEPTPDPTPDPAQDPEPSTSDFDSQTDAPELQSIEAVTTTASTAMVRYTFDEPVRADVDEEQFRLYGINTDTEQFEASSASRVSGDNTSVDAVFSREQFDVATAAGVANGAVQNLDLLENPERTLGLQSRGFPAGQTAAPDLVSVGGWASGTHEGSPVVLVNFEFDQTVTSAAANRDAFGVVLADGTRVEGPATNGSPNSTTVQVRLDHNNMTLLSAQARRAYTTTAAVVGSGGSSPRRAIAVAGGGSTGRPDLVSVTLRPAQHQVVYTFDERISAGSPVAAGFTVYYIDGTQRAGTAGSQLSPTPPTLSSDRHSVTVTFSQDAVNNLVVGATVNNGAVNSLEGVNAVDSRGVAAEFPAGHVLGPRLIGATIEADTLSSTVTWRFDKAVDFSSSVRAGFVLYTDEGDRLTTAPSSSGAINPTSCSVEGDDDNEVECTVMMPPGTTLKLAAVEYDTVENDDDLTGDDDTVYPNYEQSRPLAPA